MFMAKVGLVVCAVFLVKVRLLVALIVVGAAAGVVVVAAAATHARVPTADRQQPSSQSASSPCSYSQHPTSAHAAAS